MSQTTIIRHLANLALLAAAAATAAAAAAAQEFEGIDAADAAIDVMASSTDAAATSASTGATRTPLPFFYAVRACVPFNVLVTPSSDMNEANDTESGGSILVKAPAEVLSATQVEVIDSVVVLSVNGSFEANNTIMATVFPANATALRAVQNFGVGKIVAKDLRSEDFSTSASSIGGVYVYNLTASRVQVISAGTTTVLLNGTIRDADVQTSGTARAFLLGVSGTSDIELGGISTAYIEGSPDVKIRGTADSLSNVLYTDGDCDVQPSSPLSSRSSLFGRNFFGNPCRKVEPLDLSFQHTFSCGLLSNGTSNCSGPRQRANVLGISLNASQTPPAPEPAIPDASADADQLATPTTAPTMTIVRRPGGQVTTGTYTSSPGASAQAGSRVSGTGFLPFGLFQRQAGDAPSEVDNVFTVGSAPSQTSTAGQRAAMRGTLVRLSIPEGGSSLSVVNVECDDSLVPMLEKWQK